MFNSIKITVLYFCLILFVSSACAQKSGLDIAGNWKVDYEASKALMSAEDKANFEGGGAEMSVKMMMQKNGFHFDKSGKFENTVDGKVTGNSTATWKVNAKTLSIMIEGFPPKEYEIKEASKTKLVLHDKNGSDFKTVVYVPVN